MRAESMFVCAVLVLAGCAEVTADRIKKQYTDQVRLLEIVPVYPPREDVQVGDLRLEYYYPGRDEGILSEDITSVTALVRKAEQNLADRVLFADKEYDDKGVVKPASLGINLGANGQVVTRAIKKTYPLPQVALPKVTVRATNSFSAGLLSPLQALGLLIGNSSDVTLDFNDVRVFGTTRYEADTISKDDVCQVIKQELKFKQLKDGLIARAEEYDDKNKIPENERQKRKFRIKVVSQVYLTKKITFIYNNAQIRAAAAQALKGGKAAQGTVPVPTIINITGSVAANAVPNFTSVAAGAAPPANGVSVGSATSLGISVDRDFERPVVVAYAGADYDLDEAVPEAPLKSKAREGESKMETAGTGVTQEVPEERQISPFENLRKRCDTKDAILPSKTSNSANSRSNSVRTSPQQRNLQ